jgi:hypothetical protein
VVCFAVKIKQKVAGISLHPFWSAARHCRFGIFFLAWSVRKKYQSGDGSPHSERSPKTAGTFSTGGQYS